MNKDKLKIFDRDMMKCLALFIMFWGHLAGWVTLYKHGDIKAYYSLPMWEYVLIYTSLFCPPVMFFFVADGYKYTRDRKKYAKRLFVFACITQPLNWLLMRKMFGWWNSNVIFTLFFGLLAIMAWESRFKLWQRIVLIILCCGATALIQSDWIVFGVLFILFLHIFRDKPKHRFIAYMSLTMLYFLPNLFSLGKVPTDRLLIQIAVMMLMFVLAYLCMTVFYNGKKGKYPIFAKWFFYGFYPLHYLIIWIVAVNS
ncbi:MAG: conjugal transfer protein TraX [Ruminococcus sp.]|uniref:TraX family protein n=1 Tax=Ruminococcus sp. TaxID=41978 RepID=UPI0025DCB6F4|nr:TraX family protein [Ruminococcus sp.]MCR5599626.1 conjugal transfer protein TraX [Ruminococcus sp.]